MATKTDNLYEHLSALTGLDASYSLNDKWLTFLRSLPDADPNASLNDLATQYYGRVADPGGVQWEPVVNIFKDPACIEQSAWGIRWFGGGGGDGTQSFINEAPIRGNSIRKTWTAPGIAQDVGFQSFNIPIVGGKPYRFSAWVRSSFVVAHRIFLELKDKDGATIPNDSSWGPQGAELYSFDINEWGLLSRVVNIPQNTTTLNLIWGPYNNNQNMTPVGGTVDGANVSITEYIDKPVYGDGEIPGWRWLGTPNASQSAGFIGYLG